MPLRTCFKQMQWPSFPSFSSFHLKGSEYMIWKGSPTNHELKNDQGFAALLLIL